MIPPIVGVPAFAWWPSGPSSRMCCPNSRSRMKAMNLGRQEDADQQRGGARDQDAPHQPSSGAGGSASAASASATASRPIPREAFTRMVSPARTRRGHERGCGRRVGREQLLPAVERVRQLAAARADRDEQLDAERRRVRADLGMEAGGLRTQLQHVAEHGDAPPLAGGRSEVVEGRAHGHRVGVVAVVDDGDPVCEPHPLAAPSAERDRHTAGRSDPDRRTRRRPRRAGCRAGAPAGSRAAARSARPARRSRRCRRAAVRRASRRRRGRT